MKSRILAIAGNIGVGKSSFTARYARAARATPAFEPAAENPYLADFYGDMPRWGFQSQIWFLTSRVRQWQQLSVVPGLVVQDRSVYEDAEIFARNLHLQGSLSERDWRTYHALYESLCAALPPPALVVYLKASLPTLKDRIAKRGRDFERGLADDYLLRLNALYDEWAARFTAAPVLTLPTDGLDFVHRDADFEALAAQVRAALS